MPPHTIVALASAAGQAGVAVIRLSGANSIGIAHKLFKPFDKQFSSFKPRYMHYGAITQFDGSTTIDDVLIVAMPAPHSFTGEDVIEIHGHGSPVLVAAILQTCLQAGATLAERGEFTKRAFLNGKLDLAQAEAVADLIAAPAIQSARFAQARLSGVLSERIVSVKESLLTLRQFMIVAVDFPDDEVDNIPQEDVAAQLSAVSANLEMLLNAHKRTHIWQDGALVVLAGQVNAGKSSILNALLGRNRALVSDVPGTTRDFIEEGIILNSLPIRLIDTAGLRETGDIVESLGIEQSHTLIEQAHLVVIVYDAKHSILQAEQELIQRCLHNNKNILLVANKTDTLHAPLAPLAPEFATIPQCAIAAKTREGIDILANSIEQTLLANAGTNALQEAETDLVPNLRQAQALERALQEISLLHTDICNHIPYDLCTVRLDTIVSILEEITGQTTPLEVMNSVFESFCIGK